MTETLEPPLVPGVGVPGESLIDVMVEGVVGIADQVVAVTLTPATDGTLPAWQPGAHVNLHLPGGLVRPYSLCGDPVDRSRYTVAVLHEPGGGGGSSAVHALTGGERLL